MVLGLHEHIFNDKEFVATVCETKLMISYIVFQSLLF